MIQIKCQQKTVVWSITGAYALSVFSHPYYLCLKRPFHYSPPPPRPPPLALRPLPPRPLACTGDGANKAVAQPFTLATAVTFARRTGLGLRTEAAGGLCSPWSTTLGSSPLSTGCLPWPPPIASFLLARPPPAPRGDRLVEASWPLRGRSCSGELRRSRRLS